MVRSAARALHQPGFTFGRRIVFGDDQLTSRFYAAVVGPTDDADLEELRLNVEKKLKALFRICLQSREFYTALRGSKIFWGFVAEQWDTLEHVEPDEAATFVETYCEAREKTHPSRPAGELAAVVDQFIVMRGAMLVLDPAEQLQVALRPSAISQTTLGLANLSIGNDSSRPANPWPPSYFTEQEVAWLSNEHVLSQVYGLTPQKKPSGILRSKIQ